MGDYKCSCIGRSPLSHISSPHIAEATTALAADDVHVSSVLNATVDESVDPCELCWSLIQVATAPDTELCIATQKLHCCHCCQQQGCWTSNAYCGKSNAKPATATKCAFCLRRGRETWPNSSLCLHSQAEEGWHCVETLYNTGLHVCREDPNFGCVSCSKMCHADNTSDRCEFFGRNRGATWATTPQQSQDALMFRQDLHGELPHMTELPWKLLPATPGTPSRYVEIHGVCHLLGQASGQGFNCLLYSLRQCLGVDVDVRLVRADLQQEFSTPCLGICGPFGTDCLDDCTKVYAFNFLCTAHCEAAVQSIFRHCTAAGKAAILAMTHNPGAASSSSAAPTVEFARGAFCVRVLELSLNSDSGCVEGPPTAPVQLTVARENRNHFVPVLRCRSPV